MNEGALKSAEKTAARPAQGAIDWREVRSRYPAVTGSTFLNITSGTPLSNAAKAAVEKLIEAQWLGKGSREDRYALLGSTRERFARLIGANAAEIAVTKNVTEGLNIVGHAIDWLPGDNVVV